MHEQQLFLKRPSAMMMLGCRGYLLKMTTILCLTSLFLIYRILFNLDFTADCIRDAVHDSTHSINRWMDKDPYQIIIFIGQEFMDGFVIYINIFWILFIKNTRMPSAAAIFYALRTTILKIDLFPFPQDIVWRSPFISSIMVPYDHTRDFYFSGHTGLAVLIAMQLFTTKVSNWIKGLSCAMIVWFVFMLTVTRVHYSIDIVGGALFAHLSYRISIRMRVELDFFWSLPHWVYRKIRKCLCEEDDDDKLLQDRVS